MHEGHRKRILERLKDGAAGMQDHELLEILLFNVIPRYNTNPLAHSLLSAFGSLSGVLNASYSQLCGVEGVGSSTAAYLKAVSETFERVRLAENRPRRFENASSFARYLLGRLAGIVEERIFLFCVGEDGAVASERQYTAFRRDSSYLDSDEVTRFLLSQRPKGLVVAHNHPGAPCHPSNEDNKFTAQLQMICSAVGVEFYDHIVIGDDGYFSYFAEGQLQEIKNEYNIDHIIGGIGKS